jgi:transcriptional regulator with XRE-family HTH domain
MPRQPEQLLQARQLRDDVGQVPRLSHVFSANVRAERARRGWRQRDLAERTGWSTDTISDIEGGRRRVGIDDLPILCAAFGVTFARLLDGADDEDLRTIGL